MANAYIGRQGREACFRKVIEQSVLDEVSRCRIWPGNVNEKRGKKRGGYGQIRVILHHCDNRLCTEIMHLYAGTNRQNIEDKMKRDRSGKKLNIAKVKEIKRLLAAGIPQAAIARQFGVVNSIISRINTGVRWAHVSVQENENASLP